MFVAFKAALLPQPIDRRLAQMRVDPKQRTGGHQAQLQRPVYVNKDIGLMAAELTPTAHLRALGWGLRSKGWHHERPSVTEQLCSDELCTGTVERPSRKLLGYVPLEHGSPSDRRRYMRRLSEELTRLARAP